MGYGLWVAFHMKRHFTIIALWSALTTVFYFPTSNSLQGRTNRGFTRPDTDQSKKHSPENFLLKQNQFYDGKHQTYSLLLLAEATVRERGKGET